MTALSTGPALTREGGGGAVAPNQREGEGSLINDHMLWDISSRQIRWLTWTWRKSTGPVCRGPTEERGLRLFCLRAGHKFRGSHFRHNPGKVQMARIHASCAQMLSPFPTNLTSICLEAVFTNFNDQSYDSEEGTWLVIFYFFCLCDLPPLPLANTHIN